jgi:tetratricopeptide (TPR) repeat protein
LSAPKEEYQQKSLQFFEHVLNEEEGGNHKFLEAMLGRAKVYEKQKKYDVALEILSEVNVCFKSFNPAFIEKSKIHILNGDWDQALETIQKVMIEER